jgi:pantoate--beta-alanine ligase
MKTVETIQALRAQVRAWGDSRIALVPTMGNLHAGHLSLLAAARARAAHTLVSVFVNPLQFGAHEDFASYPRTLERDARLLEETGCELLFAPQAAELYPQGEPATRVHVRGLSQILEGHFRPGHFDGVATVVAKLLIAATPQVAIFGEKDFQQLLIVQRMVADLALPVQIVGAPTVRDADGLALSSRNQYLDAEQRERAAQLYRTLRELGGALGGQLPDAKARAGLEGRAVEALTRAGFRVDYVAIRDAADLAEPRAHSAQLIVLAAAWLGKTRLIDNLRL